MLKSKDNAYGNLLYWGAVLAIGGFVCAALFMVAAVFPFPGGIKTVIVVFADLSVVAFIVGLLMMLATLLAGLRRTSGRPKSALQYPDTRVVARYAINGHGETLFDETYIDMEDPGVKFYVRLKLPNGHSSEYHCNPIVWSHCGEAMSGTAILQGDWIGQFIPIIGSGQGDPYRQG
jgi:hypothetical protein